MALVLTGYRPSVYTRIVRLVLTEKRLEHAYDDRNPFAEQPDAKLRVVSPFLKVPALSHDGFTLYETAAITRYLDAMWPTPPLTPVEPRAQARMAQVIAIVDAHGYWPLVRTVFSESVFRPMRGDGPDVLRLEKGLEASARVLAALEDIAREGLVLNRQAVTLADLHLAPMVDYFRRASEGRAAFDTHPRLRDWWNWVAPRPAMARTEPDLRVLAR